MPHQYDVGRGNRLLEEVVALKAYTVGKAERLNIVFEYRFDLWKVKADTDEVFILITTILPRFGLISLHFIVRHRPVFSHMNCELRPFLKQIPSFVLKDHFN